jgi:hypothetical protein
MREGKRAGSTVLWIKGLRFGAAMCDNDQAETLLSTAARLLSDGDSG